MEAALLIAALFWGRPRAWSVVKWALVLFAFWASAWAFSGRDAASGVLLIAALIGALSALKRFLDAREKRSAPTEHPPRR